MLHLTMCLDQAMMVMFPSLQHCQPLRIRLSVRDHYTHKVWLVYFPHQISYPHSQSIKWVLVLVQQIPWIKTWQADWKRYVIMPCQLIMLGGGDVYHFSLSHDRKQRLCYPLRYVRPNPYVVTFSSYKQCSTCCS